MNLDELKKKHTFLDCVYWNLLALLPLGAACLAIASDSLTWVFVYLPVFLFHFLVVEYRFFCTHCPHYVNAEGGVRCMFLWGVPRFFRPRPGPLNVLDKSMMVLGLAVMLLFPLYWLLRQPLLLVVYVVGWLIMGLTMKKYECSRCIYLHCPLNSVKEK